MLQILVDLEEGSSRCWLARNNMLSGAADRGPYLATKQHRLPKPVLRD